MGFTEALAGTILHTRKLRGRLLFVGMRNGNSGRLQLFVASVLVAHPRSPVPRAVNMLQYTGRAGMWSLASRLS